MNCHSAIWNGQTLVFPSHVTASKVCSNGCCVEYSCAKCGKGFHNDIGAALALIAAPKVINFES